MCVCQESRVVAPMALETDPSGSGGAFCIKLDSPPDLGSTHRPK
jgi:hypothetical protein